MWNQAIWLRKITLSDNQQELEASILCKMGVPGKLRSLWGGLAGEGRKGRERLPRSRIPIPAEFPRLHRHLPSIPSIPAREPHLEHQRKRVWGRKQRPGHATGTPRVTGMGAPSLVEENEWRSARPFVPARNTHPELRGGRREQQSARASGVPGQLQTTQLTRHFQSINADIKLFRMSVTLASWNWSDRSETTKKFNLESKTENILTSVQSHIMPKL